MDELHNLKYKLDRLPPLSSEFCIYRVPKRLRDVSEKAYTPQVVSLGPLHHGRQGLQAMEEHKMQYVKDFFERTKQVSLEDCFKSLQKQEAKIRACYAVTIEFGKHELTKMILVDAIFTFEVLLRNFFQTLQKEDDRIFRKPWMRRDITYDMLLLENQIPFFVLEYLYCLALSNNAIPLPPGDDSGLSLFKLIHNFFQNKVYIRPLEEILEKLNHGTRIRHFVDFALKCHRPAQLPPRKKLNTLSIPNATELHQAGVEFAHGNEKNLFDIQFDKGVLKIPHLRIRGATEIFFRNLIAYEECELHDHYINDYVLVIDSLVDSSKDVELLVKREILYTKHSGSEEAAKFISSLGLGSDLFSRHFYFTDLFEDLNAYYKVPWHKWKASLKQDYFSTPWVGLSVIVAAILLVLTFIQTVCSIIAL